MNSCTYVKSRRWQRSKMAAISMAIAGSLLSQPLAAQAATVPDAGVTGASVWLSSFDLDSERGLVSGLKTNTSYRGANGADGTVTTTWYLCTAATDALFTRGHPISTAWPADETALATLTAPLIAHLTNKGCSEFSVTANLDPRIFMKQFYDDNFSPKGAYVTYSSNWKVANPDPQSTVQYQINLVASGVALPSLTSIPSSALSDATYTSTPGVWSDEVYEFRPNASYLACDTPRSQGYVWLESPTTSGNDFSLPALNDCVRLYTDVPYYDDPEGAMWGRPVAGSVITLGTTPLYLEPDASAVPPLVPFNVTGKHILWAEIGAPIVYFTQSVPASGTTPPAPVFIPPMLPLAPVTITGTNQAGAQLTCAAPSFDPAATSMTFTWLINGTTSSSATVSAAPFSSSFTIPATAAENATVTCQVVASSSGRTSALSASTTIKSSTSPNQDGNNSNSGSTSTCTLTTAGITAASFASNSSRLSAAARNSLVAKAGKGCTGQFLVTGHVQPTKNRANDIKLSRARAQALVNVFKPLHPQATFTIRAQGTTKNTQCPATAKNRCAVVTSNK